MIKNRELALLTNVLYIMQDVSMTEQKRLWMQDRLYHMTQRLTGMPSGHGQDNGLDAQFAAISELEENYGQECRECIDELKAAEAALKAIKSRKARTFAALKYIMDIPNREIMVRLNLSRKKYEKMRASIEEAEDMAHVTWED